MHYSQQIHRIDGESLQSIRRFLAQVAQSLARTPRVHAWQPSLNIRLKITHLDGPRAHGIRKLNRPIDISSEHAALQSETVAVAVLHSLLGTLDTDDGQHRAKLFLPCQLHLQSDVID
jgi:hypothetical protein